MKVIIVLNLLCYILKKIKLQIRIKDNRLKFSAKSAQELLSPNSFHTVSTLTLSIFRKLGPVCKQFAIVMSSLHAKNRQSNADK